MTEAWSAPVNPGGHTAGVLGKLPAWMRDMDTAGQLSRFVELVGGRVDEGMVFADLAASGDLVAPYATPEALLPWLAQVVGVRPKGPVTVGTLRAMLARVLLDADPGTIESIATVVRAQLTGTKMCVVRARAGTPWMIDVIVRPGEMPATGASGISAAIEAAGVRPAGFALTVMGQEAIPAGTVLAADWFMRGNQGTWGTADAAGGVWTPDTPATFTIVGSRGLIYCATPTTVTNVLKSVSSTDTLTAAQMVSQGSSAAAGVVWMDVVGRWVSATANYRARLSWNAAGAGTLAIMRGTTALASVPVPFVKPAQTAGIGWWVKLLATGTYPTVLKAKAWPATWGQAGDEPADWMVSASDVTTAVQVKGGVGLGAGAPPTANVYVEQIISRTTVDV